MSRNVKNGTLNHEWRHARTLSAYARFFKSRIFFFPLVSTSGWMTRRNFFQFSILVFSSLIFPPSAQQGLALSKMEVFAALNMALKTNRHCSSYCNSSSNIYCTVHAYRQMAAARVAWHHARLCWLHYIVYVCIFQRLAAGNGRGPLTGLNVAIILFR